MRTNPLADSLAFLAGDTGDHHALGVWGGVLAGGFGLLVAGSLALAVANWRTDPAQRRAGAVWAWLVRLLLAAMWFQGSLWKLPLPVSGGLRYWTEQLRDNSAFAWHHALVTDFMLPNLVWLGPLVWLAEVGMTVALALGFAVRAAGLVAILFTLNLWIGLYHNGGEWPWTYVFIIMVAGFLVSERAGRALGLDAVLARRGVGRPWGRLHALVS